MRKLGLSAAFMMALSSCQCGPDLCVDKDGDGALAGAGCATATDCDDDNPARKPSATERCNGVDDDCNPATVEVCPSDAGTQDSGVDAGGCFCNEDPNDCTNVAACAFDAGAPVCFTFALADRTACVECIDVSDCAALNASATVCDLVTCNAGRCESVRRHDTTGWKVTPPLSAERVVNLEAVPLKAMWDGQNFALAMLTADGGAVVRRVSRDGTIIDPLGFPLDPRVNDIAFSGGRFLQVSSEPANGTAQPFDYIAGSFMSYDGAANTAKVPLIFDFGTSNPNAHFVSPRVAGSSGGNFLVAGQASQYFWVKFLALPSGAAGEVLTPYRPRYPNVSGGPNGFTMATQDLFVGGGRAEVGGALFTTTGAWSGYSILAPYDAPVDPDIAGACCGGSGRIASNGSTHLMAYTWDGVQMVYRPLNALLQPTAPRTVISSSNQTYQPGQPVELHTDGVNFLIVEQPQGTSLKVLRVTPQGDRLDPVSFDVSSTDAFLESNPRLVSDGQGRNLLLYQKTEGVQRNTYMRLFTTCP